MVGLVVVEVVAAVLAWRDLGRRSGDQVRGKKCAWRVFIALNPEYALAYWGLGRRSSREPPTPAANS